MQHERHQNIPAAYLILKKENTVLLLRRYNTGYQDGFYSMIAGHVDPGETFTQTIVREAKEEAGITVRPEQLRVAHVLHRKNEREEERIDVFFIAEEWSGELENREPNKCDDLSWFTLDSLPENTISHVSHVLACIKNNIFYSEYGW